MGYTQEDKVTAQQLRILFAVYKLGWKDAMQSVRDAHIVQMQSIDASIKWLNEIPAP